MTEIKPAAVMSAERIRNIPTSFGDFLGASSRKGFLETLTNECLNLLFPIQCLGCNTAGEWFCSSCQAASELRSSLDFCQLCGRSVNQPGALCTFHEATTGLTGLVSYANYHASPIKAALNLMKYQGIWAGLAPIGQVAWQSRWRYLRGQSWSAVLPIPLHPSRLKSRGYNQSELLARPLRKQLTQPHRLDLVRQAPTIQQVGLNRADRLRNMQGAFAWRGSPLTGRVLLVDDVLTTGATLMSAATTLRDHGANEIWACTLAYEALE